METTTGGDRRAAVVLVTAICVYAVAVAARTSFSVAVPLAGGRFGGSSAVLALFVVLQLGVYAVAQVPVGLLLDRFGSRRVLSVGAFVVALGQLVLALAHSLPVAIAARVLVGAGDATAFIGVLRLIPAWFSLRRVPILTQAVSILGQAGQIISAFPFLGILHRAGWATGFAVMSVVGMVAAAAAALVIRDAPARVVAPTAPSRPEVLLDREPILVTLRELARQPGTWLGFFSHWMGAFPISIFTLMWGMSWMVEGLGLSAATASWEITLSTLAGIAGGFFFGALSTRFPLDRSNVVLAGGVVSLVVWTVALTTSHPLLAAVLVAVVLGFVGPSSSLGLDAARAYNDRRRWGAATGLANMGGFTATIISVELIGVLLDGSGGRAAGDFRTAIAATASVWLVGMFGVWTTRTLVRRRLRAGALAAF